MAVVSRWALTGFPLGQDQDLDEGLNFQCPSSTPPICLGQPGDKFFSLLFSLLSWWLSCVLFLTCFRSVLRFYSPVWILFYCKILGLLLKRDVIRSMSDHQLSMLLQFSEERERGRTL